MTQTKFCEVMGLPLRGKHAKQWYNVYRVLGPIGPDDTSKAYGLDEVRQLVTGCWDWEVTDENGNLVSDRVIFRR